MFKKRLHKLLGVLAVVVLVGGLVATGFAVWPADSSNGTQEGVKVHGHWTIEVSNPDGALVERVEFDNAFLDSGILARVLARQRTVAFWRIKLISQQYFTLHIVEAADDPPGTLIFNTLTVESINMGDNAGTIVLSGTATAPSDDKIITVRTNLCTVSSGNAPSASQFTGVLYQSGFTESTLSPGIDVTTGQQVAVTVVLSFS